MDQATLIALATINRRFYGRHAREFSATRQAPWRGWSGVVACLKERAPPGGELRVLDFGCGNGRFLRFLGEQWHGPIEYFGVDLHVPSTATGETVEPRPQVTAHWYAHDFLAESEPLPPNLAGSFDLICLFGILHHVPSFARRQALLQILAQSLQPRGLMAVTLWQFANQERFRQRLVPWSESEHVAGIRVSASELEPGDFLLRWGAEGNLARYCHHVTLLEWTLLTKGLGLRVVRGYRADGASGDLNEYRLVSPATGHP
ncbi:MAG: class I SAM-dependent methyltransferase [Polyangiaceae bacterium]|nr:class I SAM-dependent methyltransferase [Polyangiaceae bacterium]